jgi:CubicO group peptidase (beta-lactamase class C family)
LIVEKVAGVDYFDYVRKNIYEPAGMSQTDHFLMDGSVPGLAARLRRAGSAWEEAPHGLRGGPAGGGFSTAQDMARFARALVSGKLIAPNTLKTLTTSKTGSLEGQDYGYGFILGRSGQLSYFGHGGTAAGVNFELAYFPSSDVLLVMFCNQDNGAFDDLRRNILKLISGAR